MSTPIVFYPHAISADVYQGANLFQLTKIFDVAPSANYRDLVEFAASQVGPQFTGTHMASPDNRFSTHQLGTLFSVTIAGDYYIARNLENHVTDLHYKAGRNLGMRYADNATSHFRMRADRNSMLVVESIEASQGQLAVARCRLCHVYNGQVAVAPLIPTAGVVLTATSTTGNLHTLGPIKVNGSWLTGVTSMRLENNVEYEEEASSGEAFLTYCAVKRYRPVLTIRTRQTDYLATFGVAGTALSSLSCFLRNKLESGINDADATAYHILAANAGYGTIKARGVQGDDSQVELSIDLKQSDQNVAAYSLAVNQQIS